MLKCDRLPFGVGLVRKSEDRYVSKMTSKNTEFSWLSEAAIADCTTVEIIRDSKGISVESLIAFLQQIVSENPAAAGWTVAHVEFGGLEKTTVVEAEKGCVVLS